MMRVWRYLYGENPLHLLVLLACFALAGYVVSMVVTDPSAWWLLVWFVGAVIAHDLVLYPLYALADQPVVLLRWARRRVLPRLPVTVSVINHIRLPVLGSAILALAYLPTISEHAEESFAFAAGHPYDGEYQRWLLVTGLLFVVSAVLYALRLGGRLGTSAVSRHRERLASTRDVADATSEPDTSQPDTNEPSTSEPGTSQPGTSQPGTSQPATSEPATSELDMTSQPDTTSELDMTSQPDTSRPDTTSDA